MTPEVGTIPAQQLLQLADNLIYPLLTAWNPGGSFGYRTESSNQFWSTLVSN
jgi:hypothetical protein